MNEQRNFTKRLTSAAEEFSKVFAEKLSDRELLERLADRLLAELTGREQASPTVEAILSSFGTEGGETDG